MQKITIYFPDDLKAALEHAASETHCNRAELIREGIRIAIARHQPPAPQSGIFESGAPSLCERVDEFLDGFGAH